MSMYIMSIGPIDTYACVCMIVLYAIMQRRHAAAADILPAN